MDSVDEWMKVLDRNHHRRSGAWPWMSQVGSSNWTDPEPGSISPQPRNPRVGAGSWDEPGIQLKHGYGSIPINTIFRGMNIHLPAILMFTRGTRF